MRILFLFLASLTSCTLMAQTDLLSDRMNVMECSHDEVVAYMELPDPKRQVMSDFNAWTSAYQSTEVVRAESDPTVCIGLLYGDLEALGNQVKAATSSLMNLTLPGLDDVLDGLGDLQDSICKRAAAGVGAASERIVQQTVAMKNLAKREVIRRYGEKAMEGYVTDAVVPPEYRGMGLQYRNGELQKDQFRNNVRKRWLRELNEIPEDL
jgi:hypothetical protein